MGGEEKGESKFAFPTRMNNPMYLKWVLFCKGSRLSTCMLLGALWGLDLGTRVWTLICCYISYSFQRPTSSNFLWLSKWLEAED